MENLFFIFTQTLSVEKVEREAAEQRLRELYSQESYFLLHLLQFATTADTQKNLASSSSSALSLLSHSELLRAQLAAAIHFRNIISESNWNRKVEISPSVQEIIRKSIVRVQIEPQLDDKVRRQLLSATSDLIIYDYPQRWASLLPDLTTYVNECLQHIRLFVEEKQQCDLHYVECSLTLQRLKHCLSILRCVCKYYEDVQNCTVAAINEFCNVYLPSLLQIMSSLFLQKLWSRELEKLNVQQTCPLTNLMNAQPSVSYHNSMSNSININTKNNNYKGVSNCDNLSYFVEKQCTLSNTNVNDENVLDSSLSSPLLVETSHCMRLVLKCIWSLITPRLPKVIHNTSVLNELWQSCVTGPLQGALMYLLPWSTNQLQRLKSAKDNVNTCNSYCLLNVSNNNVHTCNSYNSYSATNSYSMYEEHFVSFQHSPMWRVLKWSLTISNKLLQELSESAVCRKRLKSIAQEAESQHYALTLASMCLQLIRWHCTSHYVTSKAYILTIENLITLVPHKACYAQFFTPNMEELLTRLILPRLCISEDELEEWQSNPEEYIQREYNPISDLYSAKVNSANLMISLITTENRELQAQCNNLLNVLYSYIEQEMEVHVSEAIRCTNEDMCYTSNAAFRYNSSNNTQVDEERKMRSSSEAAAWAARCVDANLYCLYTLKKIIRAQYKRKVKSYKGKTSLVIEHENSNSNNNNNINSNNINCNDNSQIKLPCNIILPRLESFVNKFIVPLICEAKVGFLRARAVSVFASYVNVINWTNTDHFQAAINCILPLLHDEDVVVQIQTCTAFTSLISNNLARPILTHNIGPLLEQYFRIMCLTDNDAVIRTLRKTISLYHSELIQWAMQITNMLADHFSLTYQHLINHSTHSISGTTEIAPLHENGKKNSINEVERMNELDNKRYAADELLETFITVIKELPPSALAKEICMDYILGNNTAHMVQRCKVSCTRETVAADVVMCIQDRLGGMLVTLLSQKLENSYDFIDVALRLVVLLIERCVGVHASMWPILLCIYLLLINGATDYFNEIVPVINAYLQAAPLDFMYTPLHVLCAHSSPNIVEQCLTNNNNNSRGTLDQSLLMLTPIELVHRMCTVVLEVSSLHNCEIVCVPMLWYNVILCYWNITQNSEHALRHYHLTSASIDGQHCNNLNKNNNNIILPLQLIPSAASWLEGVLAQILHTASNRAKQSNSFRVTLFNVVLLSIIAEPMTALRIFSSYHTLTSFFELYVRTCMPGNNISNSINNNNMYNSSNNRNCDHNKGKRRSDNKKWVKKNRPASTSVFEQLRRFDRVLLIKSFSLMLECACNIYVGQVQPQIWHSELINVLCGVWESGIITAYAEREVKLCNNDIKCLNSNMIRKSENDNVDDEESDEWEDETSEEGSEECERLEELEEEESSEEEEEEGEEEEEEMEDEVDDNDDDTDSDSSILYDDLNDSEACQFQKLLLHTEVAQHGSVDNNNDNNKKNNFCNTNNNDEYEDDILNENSLTLECSLVKQINVWEELRHVVTQQWQRLQEYEQHQQHRQGSVMAQYQPLVQLLTTIYTQCNCEDGTQNNICNHLTSLLKHLEQEVSFLHYAHNISSYS